MTDLRKEARGRQCQARIPGVCNFNPETTVLGHVRMAGITGAGEKAPDLLGAWVCSDCHDCIDGRAHKQIGLAARQTAMLAAVIRTQSILIREGKIHW